MQFVLGLALGFRFQVSYCFLNNAELRHIVTYGPSLLLYLYDIYRKTEYIASEYYRTQFKSEKVEAKVGYNIKKMFNPDDLYKDRESQLKTIERTFQSVRSTFEF